MVRNRIKSISWNVAVPNGWGEKEKERIPVVSHNVVITIGCWSTCYKGIGEGSKYFNLKSYLVCKTMIDEKVSNMLGFETQ